MAPPSNHVLYAVPHYQHTGARHNLKMLDMQGHGTATGINNLVLLNPDNHQALLS
jgi:hypothetical protein